MADRLPATDRKDARLQWVRSVGAFLVVCLHSASELMYGTGYGSAEWWFVNIINGLSRCAVPLFVMASGAVFLDRCDGFAPFYRKRIRRLAVPLIFWSVFYIAVGFLLNRVQLTNIGYLKIQLESLYNGKPYYHLWYLYMLIGLYLAVPFLQRLWTTLTGSQKLLFTAICIGLAAIAPFEHAFLPVESGNPFFLLFRFLPYVGYFVCGHYVKTLADKKRGLPAAPAVILMAILAAVTIIGSYYAGSKEEPGKYFFHYLSVNVIGLTVLLFYLLMRGVSASGRPPAFIRLVDRASLAVYLIHPALLILIGYLYRAFLPQGFLFGIFVTGKIVIVFMGSLALGWALAKVPGLRRTVE